jgi:hypothetical protein
MNSLEIAMLIHEVNDFFTLVNREKMVHYTWKKKFFYSYVTNFERRSRAMKHYESYQIKKNCIYISFGIKKKPMRSQPIGVLFAVISFIIKQRIFIYTYTREYLQKKKVRQRKR